MAYKTIALKRFTPVEGEALADAALSPGHLLELTTTGVKKHATSGGRAEKMFALEDELQGKEIGDAYSQSNRVKFNIFRSGDEVYARVTGSPAVGKFLCSNGDGTLRACKTDSSGTVLEDTPVAVLLATVASSMAPVRIV